MPQQPDPFAQYAVQSDDPFAAYAAGPPQTPSQGYWEDHPVLGKTWHPAGVAPGLDATARRRDANMVGVNHDWIANKASQLPEWLRYPAAFAGSLAGDVLESLSAPENVAAMGAKPAMAAMDAMASPTGRALSAGGRGLERAGSAVEPAATHIAGYELLQKNPMTAGVVYGAPKVAKITGRLMQRAGRALETPADVPPRFATAPSEPPPLAAVTERYPDLPPLGPDEPWVPTNVPPEPFQIPPERMPPTSPPTPPPTPPPQPGPYGNFPKLTRMAPRTPPPGGWPVDVPPGESLPGFPRVTTTEAPASSLLDELLNRGVRPEESPPNGPYGNFPKLTPTEAPPPPPGGWLPDVAPGESLPGYPQLTPTEPPPTVAAHEGGPYGSLPGYPRLTPIESLRDKLTTPPTEAAAPPPAAPGELPESWQPFAGPEPPVTPPTEGPSTGPPSPLQAPRVERGAERVGRGIGQTKEEVRQATDPILGEQPGEASPILPEAVLQRIIDKLRTLPRGGPEREAYVQAATSGKAQWQIENIRRTLEHLGLIVPAAVGGQMMRGRLRRASGGGQ